MKLVCIIEYPGLTYHKKYDQVDSEEEGTDDKDYFGKNFFGKNFIYIIDNNNVQKRYTRDFFIPLEEFREKKLLELGL
jgi:hypothetical protein